MSPWGPLGCDFIATAKLSLTKSDDTGVNEIQLIEVDDCSTKQDSDDLIINDDLLNEDKFKIRRLFDECYVKPCRPVDPKHGNYEAYAYRL